MGKFFRSCLVAVILITKGKRKCNATYARICVGMEFNKGFPQEVYLMAPNYVWVQKLNYDNISFRCRECYERGHVIKNYPKPPQNK